MYTSSKKPVIVPISAKAEHGKDFCAAILKEKLELIYKKRVLILHYADFLKMICEKYFGWDGKKDEKGRKLLQYIGTDVVRAKIPDYWVQIAVSMVNVLGENWDFVLIPDSRFPDEIETWKKYGYSLFTIRVHRNNFVSSLTEEQLKHTSETSLDDYVFDYYLFADSGEKAMSDAVDKMLKTMSQSIDI